MGCSQYTTYLPERPQIGDLFWMHELIDLENQDERAYAYRNKGFSEDDMFRVDSVLTLLEESDGICYYIWNWTALDGRGEVLVDRFLEKCKNINDAKTSKPT